MLKTQSSETHKRILLGAGVLYCDIENDFIDADDARAQLEALIQEEGHFLGATREGAVFQAQPRIKRYRTDGEVFYNGSGYFVSGWEATFSVEFVEISQVLLDKLMQNDDQQFSKNLIWFGELSGGGMLLIELRNPASVAGIDFRVSNAANSGSELSGVFKARTIRLLDVDLPPFEVRILEPKTGITEEIKHE